MKITKEALVQMPAKEVEEFYNKLTAGMGDYKKKLDLDELEKSRKGPIREQAKRALAELTGRTVKAKEWGDGL